MKTTTQNDNGRPELQAIRDAAAATASLADSYRRLTAQHEQARHELVRLGSLPEPTAAVCAHIERWVDATAAAVAAEQAAAVVLHFSARIEIDDDGSARRVNPGGWVGPHLNMRFNDLVWLCPDLVKAALKRAAAASTYQSGPAIEDREALIETTRQQILEIEENHAGLVDGAAELGIVLQHLATVRARRDTEALRLSENGQAHAEQLTRSARVNATYDKPKTTQVLLSPPPDAPARTGGHSKYLAANRPGSSSLG